MQVTGEVKGFSSEDWKLTVVVLSHSLLDEGVFVLQLPLLHGRVDDQLIQLHRANDSRVNETGKLNCERMHTYMHTLIYLLILAVCV